MTLPDDRRVILNEALSRQRRAMAATSPRVFAQLYLQHHFRLPESTMHRWLFGILEEVTVDRGERVAVAAPRGHAKSTVVSLAYVLWSILYEKEQFVLLVSATQGQAIELLRAIKEELQTNERLIRDFPQVCYPPGSKPAPKPWRDNHITLRNGIAIKAYGAGQSIRGIKKRQHRPSLMIVDDLEEQDHTLSAEQREKLRSWFERTLLKAGDSDTNVVVVGTILHYDSLLANLTEPDDARRVPGWYAHRFRAVREFSDRADLWQQWEAIRGGRRVYEDLGPERGAKQFLEDNREEMLRGTKVLWPEREDYERLMDTRLVEGRVSFQAEKQNEPLDPEQCLFKESSFIYWDDEFAGPQELIRSLGSNVRFFGACDPSLGRGRGDYSAITVLAEDRRTKVLYVIVADIARRMPEQTIERIMEYHKMYSFKAFGVEANQFQELMVRDLRTRLRAVGRHAQIEAMVNSQNKEARIAQLEPIIQQGQLRLSRRHHDLLEQLCVFPQGAHDDGPDALEMAVRTHEKRKYGTIVTDGRGTILSRT